MKLTEIKVKPVEPPNRVLLNLSQEEASLLWRIARYYIASMADTTANTVPSIIRLRDKLAAYQDKAQYPFDYFKDEA